MLQICQNIALARKAAGKTQQEMADLLNMNRSTFAHWEKNIVPNYQDLLRIANILNINIQSLTGSAPAEPGKTSNNEVNEPHLNYGHKKAAPEMEPLMIIAESNRLLANANHEQMLIIKQLLHSDAAPGNPKVTQLQKLVSLSSKGDQDLSKLGKLVIELFQDKKE